MQAFLSSVTLVALAELGDKTQLLSLVLAARLRRPYSIIAGILAATLINHTFAGAAGVWLATAIPIDVLHWIIGLSCIAFGLWTLYPDSLNTEPHIHPAGAFVTTLIAFFLAEMGDKTQFATLALAARFHALAAVVLGTTVGMMLADVPVVLMGEALAQRIPIKQVRWSAAVLFVGIGALALFRRV
jgi:putative Ca2+/H+ antiporter (TMEM165/GDT1 family)